MPCDQNPDSPLSGSVDSEHESSQKKLRPNNQYLTFISDNEGDHCLILCTLPAGAIVPLHSHADRETSYVVSGKLEALREEVWEKLGPGEMFDVQDGTKHAWRNSSPAAASRLCVTTKKMAKFLREISVPVRDALPSEEHAQRLRELFHAYGYWLGSPEENAAVGLDADWSGLHD